ncbi:MAG TPA: AsmA-like C-terminal region-containing protein, partial [Methylobacterium sp.]
WPLVSGRIARGLEDRLAAATGQPWRVGDVAIGLDPAPHLLMHDIRVGAQVSNVAEKTPVFGLVARRARVSGPIALLFGAEGSARVVVDGVALQAPIPAARPGEAGVSTPDGAALGPIEGVAALRAVLSGVAVTMPASGRTLTASAQDLDLTLDLAGGGKRTDIRASFEAAGYAATLAIDLLGTGASPLRITLDQAGHGKQRLAASAKLAAAPGTLRFDEIAGTIDREPFSGRLALDHAAKPSLTADLRFDALTLTGAEEAPAAARRDGTGLVIPVGADLIPDPAWFEPFDAKAALTFAHLTLGDLRLGKAAVTASVKEGGLDLTLVSDAAYEGTARMRYVLGREGADGRHQLSLSLTRARALPLLSDLAGVRAIDGAASARIDVQARGRSHDALLRSAAGFADLSVADGRIDGLDIAGLIGLMPGAGRQRGEARDPPARGDPPARDGVLGTTLSLLGGSFSIGDGQAVTNDLQLKTALLDAKGVGRLDLVGRALDVRLTPTLIAPGAGRNRRGLDVPIRVTGPWINPSVTADVSQILDDPAAAIDTLQGLGSNLLGPKGGDLGGLLDSFLPKPRERPAPERRRP